MDSGEDLLSPRLLSQLISHNNPGQGENGESLPGVRPRRRTTPTTTQGEQDDIERALKLSLAEGGGSGRRITGAARVADGRSMRSILSSVLTRLCT